MGRRTERQFVVRWGALAIAASACAERQDRVQPAVDGAVATLDASTIAEAGGFLLGDSAVGASCSPDLRSVVGPAGETVMACADDQGCAGGRCVAACDAAAASHGSLGCDFVVTTPAFVATIPAPCFAVFLTNGWPKAAAITVTRAGVTYDPTLFARVPSVGANATAWPALPAGGLPPNDVAVLFLSADPTSTNAGSSLDCPVPVAIHTSTDVRGITGTGIDGGPAITTTTGRGPAWHVTSSVPLNAYDVLPYGGAPSYLPGAQLLLPTSAWGTSYVALVPPLGLSNDVWGQIVAAQDDTHVTVLPTVDLPAGTGVASAPSGTPSALTLSADEVLQWHWLFSPGDMSGTVISSDKPILFVGGHGDLCLASATSLGGGCDAEHDLVPPVSALGSSYAIAPYATRRADLAPESVRYRAVGTTDGTTLSYDPPIASAPSTLGRGQVVDFEATGPFIVQSQDDKHPLWIVQIMPGCDVTGGSRSGIDPAAPYAKADCLGDEDVVGVIPPAQWLSRYVFFTDPTYATTNLVITRSRTPTGLKDVTVDCVGPIRGWQPVGSSGTYEFTTVDLVRATAPNGACQNGPHTAESDGPFGLVVWGLDSFSSYSYPAGGSFRAINSVVIPAQ
jgi:hypothetical protein